MQVLFRDNTRAEISVCEGTQISFMGETLVTDDSAIDVSEIDRITFTARADSVDEVLSSDISIIIWHDHIEISGRPVWLAEVSVFGLDGVRTNASVSKPAPERVIVDCSALPTGYWILRVKDKSLKFHKK